MADSFASLNVYCHYSTSQEDLFENSLIMREEISPESSSPPSPSAAIFAANGIIICSAPETPASETAVHPSTDEFKTPPEEPRRSSSEEAPPPLKTSSPPQPQPQTLSPSHGGEFHGSESAVETDCGELDGGTQDLGFSLEEGNRSPRMVEILADGRVRVGEVSSSVRVGEKRERSFEEPSPSKRVRVSVDSSLLVNSPDLECQVEIGANCEADQMIDTDVIECDQMIDTDVIESCEDGNKASANNGGVSNGRIRVSVDSSVLVDTPDLECPVEIDTDVIETDQMVDTDVIESCEDGKEECANNGGVSNVEQEHEEEDKEEEREEGIENIVDGAEDKEEAEEEHGDGGDETVMDGAEDPSSKQGRRSLPQSWTCRNGGNREAGGRPNTERGSSGKGTDVVLEVLRWLAREQREKRRDQGGSGDFLETAMRRGLTFP